MEVWHVLFYCLIIFIWYIAYNIPDMQFSIGYKSFRVFIESSIMFQAMEYIVGYSEKFQ